MYDLRFYSEYFFRARPEFVEVDQVHDKTNKDRQQLMDECATAVEGLARRAEAKRTPEHREGTIKSNNS